MRSLIRRLQFLIPPTKGVTILAYHLVGAGTDSPVDISTEVFDAHLESLSGCVDSLDEALESLENESSSRKKVVRAPRVVLTFDDAYANFHEIVYPRLLEKKIPALLYVPTGFIDQEHPAPISGTEHLPACTWKQLREMADSGLVTLGSHTVTHPSLTKVDRQDAAWELEASRQRIEDMIENPVEHFCYPRGLWTTEIEADVSQHYSTATIGGGGTIKKASHPFRLQRTSIRSDFPPDLSPLIKSNFWLEERLADIVRRRRN